MAKNITNLDDKKNKKMYLMAKNINNAKINGRWQKN